MSKSESELLPRPRGPDVTPRAARQLPQLSKVSASKVSASKISPQRDSEWRRWLRNIDRGRRAWQASPRLPKAVLAELTVISFALDGLFVLPDDSHRPNALRGRGKSLQSRSSKRLRNHMAVLCAIARCCARGGRVREQDVLRWYTSISSGLSTSVLSMINMHRIARVADQINSPQLRLQTALAEIAQLHADLLADPIFPGFNGILARLLLMAHLARNGLPPVLLDVKRDAELIDPSRMLSRLMELIPEMFEALRTASGAASSSD